MMGGMPSGMIGGMMAIMGTNAIGLTVAGGLLLVVVSWAWVMRGRYHVAAAYPGEPREAHELPALTASENAAVLLVKGMTCDACRQKVTRKVGALVGVELVEVDVEAGRVRVEWGDGFEGLDGVRDRIERLGYSVEGTG
jgi:copper chaperone CopZ